MRLKNFFKYYIIGLISLLGTIANAAPHETEVAKYNQCLAKTLTNANEAYEDGLQWRLHGGGMLAERCIAIALIEKGEAEIGARRLLAIANASDGTQGEIKLSDLIKAANGFLIAELPNEAISALDMAIELKPNDGDLLLDRARAKAMMSNWADAETDLTTAMANNPPLGLALRLRAETRLQQAKYDAAEADINEAMRLEPNESDNYYMRGRLRIARRTGQAPD